MFASQHFVQRTQRALGDTRLTDPTWTRTVAELLVKAAPGTPREMAVAMVDLARDARGEPTEILELAGDLVDLVRLEYDDVRDPVEPELWHGIRDIVDEFASALDMDSVQYIMERVVDHRALGKRAAGDDEDEDDWEDDE